MRFGLLILFITLAVCASAQFKFYEQGIDAYQAKDYPRAINLLNEYLDKGTRDKSYDVEVRYYVALAYFKTQYFTSAVREFDKALQLGHKNTGNIHWFSAKGYSELKAYRESIEEYTKAIELVKEPANQTKLYFERAVQYEKQSNQALAIVDLDKSLTFDKSNSDALRMLDRLRPVIASGGRDISKTKKREEAPVVVKKNIEENKIAAVTTLEAKTEPKLIPISTPPVAAKKEDKKEETSNLVAKKKEEDKLIPINKELVQVASNEVSKDTKIISVVTSPTIVQKKSETKDVSQTIVVAKEKADDRKILAANTVPVQIAATELKKEDKIIPAATPPIVVVTPTLADEYKDEKRYALVIGNAQYKFVPPLKNSANDANDIAIELERANFEVIKVIDGDYAKMREAFRTFNEKLNTGPKDQTIGLFYYAGHGLQNEGENYLIPIEANVQYDEDIPRMCLPMQRVVLANMERSSTRMNIVIMDACRNNPFPSASRGAGAGLAEVKRAKGSFIAYATAPGSTASDGEGRNGLYTQELLKAMKKPGRTIESVFKEVRYNVLKQSGDRQNTWDSSNIIGDFYFKF